MSEVWIQLLPPLSLLVDYLLTSSSASFLFTLGIIMGLVGAFLFFSILYVAISALASVEVSYFAFTKQAASLEVKKNE